jgi:hypothetical protein
LKIIIINMLHALHQDTYAWNKIRMYINFKYFQTYPNHVGVKL